MLVTQAHSVRLTPAERNVLQEGVAMQWRNSTRGYGAIPQVMHWITVALVILAWFLGQFDDIFPKGPARAAALFVHISAGLSVAGLVVLRLCWRLADVPPPLERTVLGAWLDHTARLAHYALYALLIAVPLSGIALQFVRGDALPLFGLAEIASPLGGADRALRRTVKEVHEVAANALIILAMLHAAAALMHHWLLRDRTLVRMLPGGWR
jgi:cytochrome b561